jgi:hypothetical protein
MSETLLTERLEKSAQLMAEDRFDEARKHLLKNPHPEAPEWHYNLALTYLNSDLPAKGALHLDQALTIRPRMDQAQKAIELTDSRLGNRKDQLPFFQKWSYLDHWMSSDEAWLLIGVAFLAFFVSLTIKLWRKTLHASIPFLVFLFISCPLLVPSVLRLWTENLPLVIATESWSTLRSGPSPTYSTVGGVPGGVRLKVIEEERGWKKVSLGGDRMGWLKESRVQALSR